MLQGSGQAQGKSTPTARTADAGPEEVDEPGMLHEKLGLLKKKHTQGSCPDNSTMCLPGPLNCDR